MKKNKSVIHYVNHPEKVDKPSDVLRSLFKQKKIHSVSANLFNQLPHLRSATHRLVAYLTCHWPDPLKRANGLLEACLKHVLDNADDMLSHDADLIEVQTMFIETVAEELALSLKYTLMYRKKSLWIPFEPNMDVLEDIINDGHITSLMWTTDPYYAHDSPNSKLICASRIFTMTELESAGLMV